MIIDQNMKNDQNLIYLQNTECSIESFIRDSVSGACADGIVLGLSGGIDSALVAALAVKALGCGKVLGIFCYDSSKTPDPFITQDYKDVRALADFLNIDFLTTDINSATVAAKNVICNAISADGSAFSLPGTETDLMSGNLRARLRMSVLYYFANRMNRLIAGTTNKTEYMTGYFTKFGDGAADIEPVGDLYKTEVRALSRFMNIPEQIIEKAPSAGFFEGQSDEADLGISYDALDIFLEMKENNADWKEICEKTGISAELFESLEKRIKFSEHKRKMPPIAKVH